MPREQADEVGLLQAEKEAIQITEEDIQVRASTVMYTAILIATGGAVLFGFSIGYTSPTLVDTDKCTDFNNTDWDTNKKALNCKMGLSDEQKSWFGSTVNFGAAAGALLGGQLADKIGLKKGMCGGYLLCLAGYLLLFLIPIPDEINTPETCAPDGSCAHKQGNVALLIVCRVVIGLGAGVICCTNSPYLNEVATIQVRGAAGACFQVGCTIGICLAYLLGLLLDFRGLAMFCVALAGACILITVFLLPNSPRWLAARKMRDPAIKALKALRRPAPGHEGEFDYEITKLYKIFIRETGQEVKISATQSESTITGGGGTEAASWSELCVGPARRALFIGVMLQIVQQFSGINAVMFYSGGILEDVYPDSTTTANTWALGIQIMQVCITTISAPFMDRAGRRFLLILAMVGMCCSTAGLAAFYLNDDPTNYPLRCVAVFSLYAYVFFFSCGLGAIPWAMMGELFPIRVKAMASSVATLVNWLGSFAITKTLDNLTDAFGPGGSGSSDSHKGRGWVFVMYGAVCFLGLLVTIGIVPETKGKSIEQIQAELSGPLCGCGRTGAVEDDEEAYAE